MKIHYWNQANFEGLLQLANALSEDTKFSSLASYCELREQGLRKQAFEVLASFLDQATKWTTSDQRLAVDHILTLAQTHPGVHQFLSHPLRHRLIIPVLESWLEDLPNEIVPLRWLGALIADPDLLERALAIEWDDISAEYMIRFGLKHIDFQTQHLVEGRFIGSLDEAFDALDQAGDLIGSLTDINTRNQLAAWHSEFTSLLDDWREFNQRRTEGLKFREWCASLGRNHQWWSIVYYE